MNSIIVAGTVTIGQLFLCSLAAYVFARLKFPGHDTLFLLYLATLMVPEQVRMIPLFIILKKLGWLNTYRGLIVPGLFSVFGTFLLKQFFQNIPMSLQDAATIDGAGRLRIFLVLFCP